MFPCREALSLYWPEPEFWYLESMFMDFAWLSHCVRTARAPCGRPARHAERCYIFRLSFFLEICCLLCSRRQHVSHLVATARAYCRQCCRHIPAAWFPAAFVRRSCQPRCAFSHDIRMAFAWLGRCGSMSAWGAGWACVRRESLSKLKGTFPLQNLIVTIKPHPENNRDYIWS